MDPLVVRHACIALQHLGSSLIPLPLGRSRSIHFSLLSVLTNNVLPEKGWYTAAEASLRAIFAVHPSPISLCTAVLQKIGKSTFAISLADGEFRSHTYSHLPHHAVVVVALLWDKVSAVACIITWIVPHKPLPA